MEHLQSAVHRTILTVDIEGFGHQRRTNPQRIVIRHSLYQILCHAFAKVAIALDDCYHEDRGDGVLILVPSTAPKSVFVESMLVTLVEALNEHNKTHCAEEQIRLRMSLHAGEINYDDHGVVGASINLAFRLLDATEFRAAFRVSRGALALIVSSWFFDEVVQHSVAGRPNTYRAIQVTVKETTAVAWVHLSDHPHMPPTLRSKRNPMRNDKENSAAIADTRVDMMPLRCSATTEFDTPYTLIDDRGALHDNRAPQRIPCRSLGTEPTFDGFLRESFLEVIPRTSNTFECRDVKITRGIPHTLTRHKHTVQVVTCFMETSELALPIHSCDFRAWLETLEHQPLIFLVGQALRPGKLTLRMLCLHDWVIREATVDRIGIIF